MYSTGILEYSQLNNNTKKSRQKRVKMQFTSLFKKPCIFKPFCHPEDPEGFVTLRMRISDINQLLNQPEGDCVPLAENTALEQYRTEHCVSPGHIHDCEMRFKINRPTVLSALILLAVLQTLTSSVQGKFAFFFLDFITCLAQNPLDIGTKTCLGTCFLSLSSKAHKFLAAEVSTDIKLFNFLLLLISSCFCCFPLIFKFDQFSPQKGIAEAIFFVKSAKSTRPLRGKLIQIDLKSTDRRTKLNFSLKNSIHSTYGRDSRRKLFRLFFPY